MSEQLTDEDLGLSSGLTDADLGLEEPALPRFAMQEAANSIPLPGYTTPFGQEIERTARAMVQSQPSELVTRAGQLEPRAPLLAPPNTPAFGGEWEGFAPPPAEPDPTWKTFPEELAKARHETFQSFAPSPEAVRRAIATGVLSPEEISAMDQKPVGTLPKVAAGVIHSLVNTTEEQTKVKNLGLLLAGGLPGKLGVAATTLFYADMVRHSPEVFNKVMDALESGDPGQEAEALTDALIHGTFLGLTGAHAANSVREGVDSFIQSNGPEARRRYYEQAEKNQQAADLAPLPQPEAFNEGLSPIQKPRTLGVNESQSNIIPTGEQAQRGVNQEAASNDAAPAQGWNQEAANAWLKGVSENNPEAISHAEASLLRESDKAQIGQRESLLGGVNNEREKIRAQADHGEAPKADTTPIGTRSPQERQRLGQQTGELGSSTFSGTHAQTPWTGPEMVAQLRNLFEVQDPQEKARISRVLQSVLSSGSQAQKANLIRSIYATIRERKPTTLPVGEAPQNSGEVGARVPTPEEPAGTQGGAGDQPSPQPAEAAPSEVPLTLRPAIQALDQIVPGTAGKRHADILPEVTKTGDWAKMQAAIAGYNEGRGFVGPDGKFHTRKESQALLEDQYGPFEMIKPDEGLHSEDLNSKGQPKKLLVAKGVDVSKAEGPFTADEKQNMAKVLPLEDFKGELKDVPHYPVIIETEHGVRYPAYISEFYDMREVGGEVTPQVHKVTNSALPGEPPDIGLSSGGLGAKEKVVAGEYPKTVEAFKADIAAGVKPPRTLSEAKPAAALAPHMAEAAPAYEHGHAVASSVPGLLIDPFGFQSARMVSKAIKDIYDSPAVKKARQDVADLWNAAALKSAPKLTRSSRPLGEAGVRYASSHMVGRTKGQIFADKVLADSGIDPVKFGTALAEDNLRSIRAARDPAEAAKVRTLVGDDTSPFKTEAEYQAFLKDPATRKAIERHQQLWAEQKDPLYRQANDLDPDLPLATRGLQTGARINLKALQPDEVGVAPIGRRAPGFRQLATLKRRDPFGRQAKGSGLAYEGNYHEIMAHGFERELPVAAQHEFLKQLIEHGDAVVTDKMVEPGLELKGEATARGYLLSLKPYTGKFIHIRKGLADEFESISGLDKPLKLPIITAFNNFMTRQSVAGLAEGATHASNLMTQIFTMPGPTANPLLNALLKSVGRADLLVSLPKVLIKSFTNQRERMLGLAEIGAAKEPYPGAIAKKILNPIDQGVRLVSDDVFKALAKKGLVENTETNRREFINQVGQYNKRLQPLLTRRLRESGLQPFVTAGQTFNAQGLRRLAMAPGVKATNNIRALALRADVAAGWLGGIVLVTALNLILSHKATGPTGTPLGSVGWVGDDRKVHTFNVFRLLGYERGARITGLGPYVEAKRQGLSPGQALTAGAQSVASTGLGMVMGPGPRFATIAATGQRPTQPWIKEAPRVPPSDSLSPLKSQMAMNIQTAMIEANPVLSSVAEVRKEMKQGKSAGEALTGGALKQITRYSPQTRMSEQKAAALPKIVDSVQLREYVDDVAKEARQLPLRERQRFINKRFRDDDLGRKYRESAWQQIERKGVLKYR